MLLAVLLVVAGGWELGCTDSGAGVVPLLALGDIVRSGGEAEAAEEEVDGCCRDAYSELLR